MTARDQLVAKLRHQAHVMKAGPNSLLVQAADTIEAQERELSEQSSLLLAAAQVIAGAVLTEGSDR